MTAAIQLWNTSHVRIVGNLFSGADVAIKQSSGLRPVKDVLVEHNLSHCYPLYEWRHHGWLTWKEVYPYSNCSLTWMGGRDILVRSNIITQAGDGIKLSPVGGHNRIEANLIAYTTDDGIEFDGPAIDLDVRNNLFVDPWDSLGISPVRQGPLRISGNVFLHSRQEPAHDNGVMLKLLGGPSHRVRVDHNLFVGLQLGWSVADSPLSDFHMHDNLLFTVKRVEEASMSCLGWAGATTGSSGSLDGLAEAGAGPRRPGPGARPSFHAHAAGRAGAPGDQAPGAILVSARAGASHPGIAAAPGGRLDSAAMIRSARFARLLAGAAGIPVALVTSLVVFRLVRHFSVDMPIEPGSSAAGVCVGDYSWRSCSPPRHPGGTEAGISPSAACQSGAGGLAAAGPAGAGSLSHHHRGKPGPAGSGLDALQSQRHGRAPGGGDWPALAGSAGGCWDWPAAAGSAAPSLAMNGMPR